MLGTATQPINLAQSRIKTNIRHYLTRKGRSPELIRQFQDGYCHGLAVLAVYGQYLSCQPNLTEPCDNWEWFNQISHLLAGWSGDMSRLTRQNEKDIDRFISLIEFFQHVSSYLPYGQGSLNHYFADTKKRDLQHEYTFGGLFRAEDFAKPIHIDGTAQTSTLLNELLKYDQRLILISSGRHTLSLFKQQNVVTLYDSNHSLGLQTFSLQQPMPLLHAIYKAYHYDPGMPSPIGFRTFTFAPEQGNYADPASMLGQLQPPLAFEYPGNRKNSTALHMAARIGSAACVNYFLARGADTQAEDSDGQTPRRVALTRRHTDIANLILSYQRPSNDSQYHDQHLRFFNSADGQETALSEWPADTLRPD